MIGLLAFEAAVSTPVLWFDQSANKRKLNKGRRKTEIIWYKKKDRTKYTYETGDRNIYLYKCYVLLQSR